jgi:hypothetical protein
MRHYVRRFIIPIDRRIIDLRETFKTNKIVELDLDNK